MYHNIFFRFIQYIIIISLIISLTSCRRILQIKHKKHEINFINIKKNLNLKPVSWNLISEWKNDLLFGTIEALQNNCIKLNNKKNWKNICKIAKTINCHDTKNIRIFFETFFSPFQIIDKNGNTNGLITGYYEPILFGSYKKNNKYFIPIYKWPSNIKQGTKLPKRKNLIKSGILDGNEIIWVNNKIEEFFLQIQGSGRVIMNDGSIVHLSFGGTNKQPYKSISKWLIDNKELTPGQVTMNGIKKWSILNPSRVDMLLALNPRFVFFNKKTINFKKTKFNLNNPIGSLGVPLTPKRSIAIDPKFIPLGSLLFLQTNKQLPYNKSINKLVFAQDSGYMIKGIMRADYFWGTGNIARKYAEKTKQFSKLWILLPSS